MGLTSAEGQKLEDFRRMPNNIFKYLENLVNPLCTKVMLVFYPTQAPSVYITTSKGYILGPVLQNLLRS
jgi:hypothetical protein